MVLIRIISYMEWVANIKTMWDMKGCSWTASWMESDSSTTKENTATEGSNKEI